MKKLLTAFVFILIILGGCKKAQKPKKITYAVKYTIEYKTGPQTIIELVSADEWAAPLGLFYIIDKKDDINHLYLYRETGTIFKEICATRFNISSYGIENWKLE